MLVGSPEYSALNINESTYISAIWKSSSGKPVDISLFPIFDVSFNTWVNGTAQTITKNWIMEALLSAITGLKRKEVMKFQSV